MAPPALRSSLALVAAAVVATVQCVAAGPPQHGYNDNSKLTRRGYKRHFGRQGIEMDMTLIHAKVGSPPPHQPTNLPPHHPTTTSPPHHPAMNITLTTLIDLD